MNRLETMQIEDFNTLIELINSRDKRFLIQFAGTKYSFPLTRDQLLKDKNSPNHEIFKYIDNINTIIGSCQLVRIDKEDKSASIGRVVIFPEHLGKGHSKKMLNSLINYSKEELKLETLYLRVFSFNKPALQCYKSIGFSEVENKDIFFEQIDDRWNCITMKKTL